MESSVIEVTVAGFSAYFFEIFEARIPLSVMRQFQGLQSNFSFEGISDGNKVRQLTWLSLWRKVQAITLTYLIWKRL